jgi:hypothetical protein
MRGWRTPSLVPFFAGPLYSVDPGHFGYSPREGFGPVRPSEDDAIDVQVDKKGATNNNSRLPHISYKTTAG